MTDILKLLALCVVGAVLAVVLRQSKNEYAMLISICATVIVMSVMLLDIKNIATDLSQLVQNIPISEQLLSISIKAVGIAVLCELSSAMCKDMGENAMALKSELVGRVALTALAIPLANELIARLSWLLTL